MIYNIFFNGKKINSVEASKEFIVKYCRDNGYVYAEAVKKEKEIVKTTEEKVDDLESENKLLKQQIVAQSEQLDFYEDCIAEMAEVVYA
jgi:predicted metal-dependent hydrolase